MMTAPSSRLTSRAYDQTRINFAKFWSMPVEAVDEKLIWEKSPSLGIAGWFDSALGVRDNVINDSELRMRERQERTLGGHDIVDDEGAEDQNVQIIRL